MKSGESLFASFRRRLLHEHTHDVANEVVFFCACEQRGWELAMEAEQEDQTER